MIGTGKIAIATALAAAALAGCTAPPAHHDPQPAPRPPASAILFPAINVTDLAATEAFYVQLLGMAVTLRVGEGESPHQEVTLNFSGELLAPEASLVLNYAAEREAPYHFDAFSRLAIRVPDVSAAVERIRAAGHPILEEPRIIEVDGATIKLAFVQDPNGMRVELIELGAGKPPPHAGESPASTQ